MSVKFREKESRIKVTEMPEAVRSGGETRPYEYPHLYQIQAGEWRISYAVEQNHLAILVLEVLNPDGTVKKDPARETLTRKMKVKLLDWPEGRPSRDLTPEDLGKKVKIKLLDLVDDLHDGEAPGDSGGTMIRLSDLSPRPARRKVTLIDATPVERKATTTSQGDGEAEETGGRRITPLDSPTM